MSQQSSVDTVLGTNITEKELKIKLLNLILNESINSFIKAIKEEWQALSQQDIDNCILSLPRRYNAVVEAEGWYTKY
ncbi:hypothetical protein GGP41_001032 [Bipolaris sorokiniana]|uniref:Uncharacterized protein n=1 Tax=Cochliobolus sativus TaxID=45130 RepID=A0A8H5ZND5_COCSA|nr:hypothetical protein GGP41_001032 [Bipolaris sorokiniana]